MLKTLSAYIGEYKKVSIKTPIYIIIEVLMEILIPFVTASIIDKGIQAGDMSKVLMYGGLMLVLAFISLFAGIQAGKYSALASTGFACNLREGIYSNIQNFAFSNIDKYSTAGLITRMTTDVTNVQNAYQMILRIAVRAPLMMICSMVLACGAAGGLLPTSLSSIVLLRYSQSGEPLGIFMVLFILFCAWFGDSGAYFVGTFFGKHKLCPLISPKKTVEGLIGGVVTVGVVTAITVLIYNSFILTEHQLSYAVLIPLSMVASLAGVVGDLSASVIKREYNVKDFGNIMPGHGGVLDRFDSVTLVAPFLYVAMSYLGSFIYA